MIKINLLQNRFIASETEIGTLATTVNRGNQSDGAGLLTNFALLLGGVILLYIYQTYNLSSLDEILRNKNRVLAETRHKVEGFKKESAEAKKDQQKIQVIERKMEIIKELSRSRLIELKALDYLQTIIPDRVWFTKINYSDKDFSFEGFSLSDEDFNTFMARLERGGVFLNVVPIRFTEESSSQGKGKAFTVTCRLGNI